MKKFYFCVLIWLLIVLSVFSCKKVCEHIWTDATCVTAKTCALCSATEGEAIGHTWSEATCTVAKTCSVCSETEGEALGHTWIDATCTVAKTCSVCTITEGESLGHSYNESIVSVATCNQDGTKKFTCEQCANSYSENYSKIAYSANELYEITKTSIGEIITYDKSGSELALGTGIVYTSDGKIITNYHVIDKAYSAKIKINEITYTVKYVLAYDKTIDLAILKIDANDLCPITICRYQHAVGKTVYAFGSSKGLTATFSQGIITYASREVDGVLYVQHDAAISGGNSGGPLIDQHGEVIGINTWTVKDSQNLNFAIATTEIDNLVYGNKLTFSEFYEKECDIFTKLKNYIVNNGTYKTSSSGNYYYINLGLTNLSGYKYTRMAYYYVSDNYITLDIGSSEGQYVYFKIFETEGVYNWYYIDELNYIMRGILYADSFDSNTLLGYSYNNITYSSMRKAVRELASVMMAYLLSYVDTDFYSIGVSAEDLGFVYF